MDKLGAVLGDITHTKLGGADSFSDQISCKYTVFILTISVVIATTRVWLEEPIVCYCPTAMTAGQTLYVNQICWISYTRRVRYEDHLKKGKVIKDDEGDAVIHYQWVTLLMVCQALMFYLPRPIWKMFNKKSGIAIHSITDAAIECYRKTDSQTSSDALEYMAKHVKRLLVDVNRTGYKKRRGFISQYLHSGSYLVTMYLFVKILYLANAVGQLYLIGAFLNMNYTRYGIDAVKKLIARQENPLVNNDAVDPFPRITLCHFNSPEFINAPRRTVQCALPLNFFYEVMFTYLWFWIVLVIVVTAYSLLSWAVTCIRLSSQANFIHSVLVDLGKVPPQMRDETDKFVYKFLRRDGCFLIKMVSMNSSEFLASELICLLWSSYHTNDGGELELLTTDGKVGLQNTSQINNFTNHNGMLSEISKRGQFNENPNNGLV